MSVLLPSSLPVPRRSLLGKVVLSAGAFLFLMLAAIPSAAAREVECEKVSYNERIIIRCTTQPGGESSSGSPTPTPTPILTVVPNGDGDDEAVEVSEDESAGQSEPAEEPAADEGDSAAGGDEVDEGDQGTRTDAESRQAAPAQDEPSFFGQTDEATTADVDDEWVAVPNDGQAANGPESGPAVMPTGATDPSNLPIIVGIAALLGAGALFFLAGGQSRRSGNDVA